jgi:hypothetical protein
LKHHGESIVPLVEREIEGGWGIGRVIPEIIAPRELRAVRSACHSIRERASLGDMVNKVHMPDEFVPAFLSVPKRQSNQSRNGRWRLSLAVEIVLETSMNVVNRENYR